MTKPKEYITVNKFYESLEEVKDTINTWGQTLSLKIDQNKKDLDAQILKMHIDYTDRIARLETNQANDTKNKRGEWVTRLLIGLVMAMAGFIFNHILTK